MSEIDFDSIPLHMLPHFNLEDTVQYPDYVLVLLSSHIKDPDALNVLQKVYYFDDRGGLKKSYLPDLESKRRKYDNTFLILEATKFIRRTGNTNSTISYTLTIRGKQLIMYLINELNYEQNMFTKITDVEYQEFLKAFSERKSNSDTQEEE